MATLMLEHQKIVLRNVSNNKLLFRKELHKSIDWLTPEELNTMYSWLKEQYWETHKEIILEAFSFAKVY